MNLKLRAIEDLGEARSLLQLLEAGLREASEACRDEPLPPEAGERFLATQLGKKETLILVAESDESDRPRAICVTAPLEDPLTGQVLPLIVGLYVDADLRHRGLAGALVQEARRQLELRGLSTLGAFVSRNDDARISMGERWGFTRRWELFIQE